MVLFPPCECVSPTTSPVAPSGDYVLYWMTAFRRTHWNFSLQRAVDWSKELNRPLLIFEALRLPIPLGQ